MDIMEKLGGITRKVGDKAGELVELGKLNGKLYRENCAAEKLQKKIGEVCFGKFRAGDPLDPEVEQLCISMARHKQAIAETQRAIRRMQSASSGTGNTAFCPCCGEKLAQDAKCCASCSGTVEK